MTSGEFREFFYKEKLDLENLEQDTIVIFDTNTLLNIYRYSNDTREKLIKAIKSIKENVWMPYQVGLEFNLNRRNVIESLKKAQGDKKTQINEKIKYSIDVLSQCISEISLKSTDAKSKKNEINSYIENQLTMLNTDLNKKVEEVYEMLDLEKDLASEIASIFEGRIGNCYTQEELDEKLKDAETRYAREIPPGYKDSKKKGKVYYNDIEIEEKYGDLIVWHQILDKAKIEENISKVVFVTDDNKGDWWYKGVNNITIGPRAELKNEMYRLAEADLFMLNANSFLNNFSNSDKDLIENEELPVKSILNEIKKMKELVNWPSLDDGELSNSKIDLEQKNKLRLLDLERKIFEIEDEMFNLRSRKSHYAKELLYLQEQFEMLRSDSNVSAIQLNDANENIIYFKDKVADLISEYDRLNILHRYLKDEIEYIKKA